MKKIYSALLILIAVSSFNACSSDSKSEPMLIVKFKFDPNQARLNNLGQPATMDPANAAQSPVFNTIGAHYMELAPNDNTQIGSGTIIYHGAETTVAGSNAIDFSQEKIVAEGETFLKIPLSLVAAGTYKWMRVSLAYQNYQINVRNAGVDYTGTLASFVGFNTYITSFNIVNNNFSVNDNKLQGYWAFALNNQPYASSGQALAGATTVPNPIHATSAVPTGSCVITGRFPTDLVLDGNQSSDVVITLSLSSNNSFEWQEMGTPNGKYEPAAGEKVTDMGLRGLLPTYVK